MNCKPGDLAVVIKGIPAENIGRIVRVTKIDAWATVEAGEAVWDCDDPEWLFPDECLKPIRDTPGADETLQWAGLPAPIKTKETA